VFAEVEHFELYDFYTDAGGVNEDVFAYSNRMGGERALVVYHNRFADTSGWIRVSAACCGPNVRLSPARISGGNRVVPSRPSSL